MVHTCPRCRRVNPAQAMFCYNDGAPLGDPSRQNGAADPARQRFMAPFVFPSGQTCHSFDELVLAISSRWDEARQMLRQGVFTSFMAGLGRGDLSVAARNAAREANADEALDKFLNRLPASVMQPARLVVDPATVNLGTLRPGQDVRFTLRLHNEGMGLVRGNISCEECAWLVFGDQGAHSKKKIFQFLHDVAIPVQIRGKALVASQKPIVARLVVESNGGHVEVPITFEVPVVPFAEGVLAGAVTPRQLAEKARDNARGAADLFARGAVAKWYEANGWTYPVQEPAASGVAAIQQYFEALGVASAPRVSVNTADLRLQGSPGETVRATVTVSTTEKKPVFAHATSDQPWLTVNEVRMEGRSATVHLRVPFVPDQGSAHAARLTIVSNGRQRFVIPVTLQVVGGGNGPARQPAPPPDAEVIPYSPWNDFPVSPGGAPPALAPTVQVARPELAEPPPRRREVPVPVAEVAEVELEALPVRNRPWLAALPVAFLAVGLSVALIHDLLGWKTGDPFAGMEQVLSIKFHEKDEAVTLSKEGGVKPVGGGAAVETIQGVWEPSMRFGLALSKADRFGQRKRLTFDPKEMGLTNNAVVRLDGSEWIFGERPFRDDRGNPLGNWPGEWKERDARVDRPMRDGRRSVWWYRAQNVLVTQTAGLVAGAQSGQIDTCLVHYRIENQDNNPHRVGLRFMLDTFIGGNDGVPFLIPGQRELCDTMYDFGGPDRIPTFIQARESPDLSNPGTIATVQLRIPGLEPPSRVTLGAWPNPVFGPPSLQEKTLWDVPLRSIQDLPGREKDSCVVIYWFDKEIPPRGSREMAFAYGLGSVAAGEGGGELALSVGGSVVPNGTFDLTAEVRQPERGQTATAGLPEGFEFAGSPATQEVPAGGASGIAPVTWKVKAGPREGTFTLQVRTSKGVSQSLKVRSKVGGIFGN